VASTPPSFTYCLQGARVDHAGARRPDLSLAEVLLGDPKGRTAHLHRGREPGVLAARASHLLGGHELSLGELFPALQIGLGSAQLGPRLIEGRLRSFELDAVPVRVDSGQDRLRAHSIAFVEVHLDDRAFDLGGHLHHLLCFEGAERLDLIDHLLDLDGSHPDHQGSACGLGGGALGAAAGRGAEGEGRKEGQDCLAGHAGSR
jgi:hypothetical protein